MDLSSLTGLCVAILSVAGVVALFWKVARGMWRRARKAEDLIDQLKTTSADLVGVRGELAKLGGRVDALTEAMDEHIHTTWHPAKGAPQQPNGPRPGRRTQ